MIEKSCDLLCIGGGGAGITAAIVASEKGANVILLSKDHIGYGNTRIIGGVMAYGDLDTSRQGEDFFRDMVVGGDYLNNQKLCLPLAKEAHNATILLERFGGIVKRDSKGKISADVLLQLGGHTAPRTMLLPSTGPGVGQGLRYGVARRKNIRTLEKTIVFDLLKEGEKVLGAVCYQLTSGEIIVIKAKKTLIATGGGGWIYYPHTDTSRVSTGDGFTLALDAGAKLVDMEQVQYIPFSLTHPSGMVGIVVGEPFSAGPAGTLKNVHGKEIISGVALKTRVRYPMPLFWKQKRVTGQNMVAVFWILRPIKSIPRERFFIGIMLRVYSNALPTLSGLPMDRRRPIGKNPGMSIPRHIILWAELP